MRAASSVIVIGGGAAGCACAHALTRAGIPVEVLEREARLGGVATSETIHGATTINDGVQGGATSYANVLALMGEILGADPHWVDVRVSFGRGADHWRNHGARTEVVEALQEDVRRFERTLKSIKRFEWLYAFVSVERALRWHGHSKRFRDAMVYATTALFFGTGNCTRDVCSVVLARVFNDDRLRLYDYDPQRFMSEAPKMFAFPKFSEFYSAMGRDIEQRGGRVTLGARVFKVERMKTCVKVHFENINGVVEMRECDRVVFACSSEQAKAMLDAGSGTTRLERWIFKNISWFDDVSITHTDEDYMKKHYEVAQDQARDMYFIKSYEQDPSLCEMSFDLTAYQPFAAGPNGTRVYQSIFLNAARDKHLWTRDEIDPSKVSLVKWWRQFGHTVRHFTRAVPFWRFVQNKRRTLYAGSYTMVNTHEIAVISGLVAAYRCGAPYPYADNEQASFQFDLYASIIHGVRRRR